MISTGEVSRQLDGTGRATRNYSYNLVEQVTRNHKA